MKYSIKYSNEIKVGGNNNKYKVPVDADFDKDKNLIIYTLNKIL